jgi:hypothetical protein
MPRLHERESIVREASIDLAEALIEWRKQHDGLTDAERMSVLLGELSSSVAGTLKYQIRYERHGNYDTPGGWE